MVVLGAEEARFAGHESERLPDVGGADSTIGAAIVDDIVTSDAIFIGPLVSDKGRLVVQQITAPHHGVVVGVEGVFQGHRKRPQDIDRQMRKISIILIDRDLRAVGIPHRDHGGDHQAWLEHPGYDGAVFVGAGAGAVREDPLYARDHGEDSHAVEVTEDLVGVAAKRLIVKIVSGGRDLDPAAGGSGPFVNGGVVEEVRPAGHRAVLYEGGGVADARNNEVAKAGPWIK